MRSSGKWSLMFMATKFSGLRRRASIRRRLTACLSPCPDRSIIIPIANGQPAAFSEVVAGSSPGQRRIDRLSFDRLTAGADR